MRCPSSQFASSFGARTKRCKSLVACEVQPTSRRGRDGALEEEETMPNKGDVHVVPSDKGWRVEVEGSGRARSTHGTQAEAAKAAREVARRNESELLLHGRNGKIRDRNTYGPDPRRTKG